MSALEVRVLGPFVVLRAGQPLQLGRSKLRDLLALLAAHSPGVVSAHSIVDELWRGSAPPSARKVVQKHISELRHLVGRPHVVSLSGGYALRDVGVDAAMFETAFEKARSDEPQAHHRWAADIAETQGHAPNFPMIADPDRVVSDLYGMIHPNASDTTTVRSVFVIGPDKKVKLMITYPQSTGRNFQEILRVIDSLQLTAKHKVSTPVNWNQGEDVIIIPAVTDDEARVKFPDGWKAVKPYLRIVPQPK